MRSITSSKEKLYLFEALKIHEMSLQGEVLDTVPYDRGTWIWEKQQYTNTDGVIFMLAGI